MPAWHQTEKRNILIRKKQRNKKYGKNSWAEISQNFGSNRSYSIVRHILVICWNPLEVEIEEERSLSRRNAAQVCSSSDWYSFVRGPPGQVVVAESGRPGRAQLLAKKRPHSRRRRLSAELQNVRETSGKLGEARGSSDPFELFRKMLH